MLTILANLLILSIGSLHIQASPLEKTVTPNGCRALKTDKSWPSDAQWKAAIPGVVARSSSMKIGPDYRIRVKTAQDVQRAVNFANENNIRVSVIASGHDFMARSTAASGLLIDVSLLKGIRVSESYTPTKEGVEPISAGQMANVITPDPAKQAAVTVGGGITTQFLNNALSPSRLFTLGAAHGSVGVVGGWSQLGGHAPLSAQYGLGVDQWLEAKIVTADGRYLVANEVSNPDLFWAIRGGGGGTYGVVVEATIKAHNDVPITVLSWFINSTSWLGSEQREPVQYLLSKMDYLKDKGVSGYFVPSTAFGSIRGIAIHPGNTSIAEANAMWKPILDKMQKFPGMKQYQTQPYRFKNYKELFDKSYGSMNGEMSGGKSNGANGSNGMVKRHGPGESSAPPNNRGMAPMDSRLLTRDHINDPDIMKALGDSYGNYAILLVTPGKQFNGSDTSALPSWRRAVVHVTGVKIPWIMSVDGLRTLASDTGAYGNEACYNEKDWQNSFWGENYPRLAKLKTRYDPTGLFWVTPGINAEQFNVFDGRVCRVTDQARLRVTESSMAPATDNPVGSNWLLDREEVFGTMDLVEKFPAPGTKLGMQAA